MVLLEVFYISFLWPSCQEIDINHILLYSKIFFNHMNDFRGAAKRFAYMDSDLYSIQSSMLLITEHVVKEYLLENSS